MRFLVLSVLAAASTVSHAGAILSCVKNGQVVIGDETTAAACADVKKKVHRVDGAAKGTLPPAKSPADLEAAKAAALAAQKQLDDDKARQLADQSLVNQFPDEASVAKARDADAEPLRLARQRSLDRLAQLEKERKPLDDEAEFYVGKPLPENLRRAIEDNEALVEGLRGAIRTQDENLARIEANHKKRLNTLRQLWASR